MAQKPGEAGLAAETKLVLPLKRLRGRGHRRVGPAAGWLRVSPVPPPSRVCPGIQRQPLSGSSSLSPAGKGSPTPEGAPALAHRIPDPLGSAAGRGTVTSGALGGRPGTLWGGDRGEGPRCLDAGPRLRCAGGGGEELVLQSQGPRWGSWPWDCGAVGLGQSQLVRPGALGHLFPSPGGEQLRQLPPVSHAGVDLPGQPPQKPEADGHEVHR